MRSSGQGGRHEMVVDVAELVGLLAGSFGQGWGRKVLWWWAGMIEVSGCCEGGGSSRQSGDTAGAFIRPG